MSLGEVFLEQLARRVDDGRAARGPRADLEAALQRLCDVGNGAWPALGLPLDVFVRHVAERLPEDVDDVPAALAALHAEDLYLACACASGDAKALAIFERDFLGQVSQYLASRDFAPSLGDDVKQDISDELLTRVEGRLPRIAAYGGQGPLSAWLRVVAFRAATRSYRASRRDERLDADSLAIQTTAPDPDLAVVRSQYRAEFRQAFVAALAALQPRDRNVIRFHHLEGLTGDVIASMYGVTRRTVHRWLEDAREQIVAGTRRRLAEHLKLSTAELESLMRALQTELFSIVDQSFQGQGQGQGQGDDKPTR